MKKHYRKENNCLNCGTILQGKYCHNCGQENLEIKESFGHTMNHAISDYFHFDHQFFSTLKPLLSKPGFLTNEYLAGRRASYLHPVKMYIFISIVYFLLVFNVRQPQNSIIHINNNPAAAKATLEKEKKQIEADTTIDENKKQALLTRMTENDTTYAQYIANQRKLPVYVQDGFFGRFFNERVFEYREKYGKRALEVFIEEVQHNIPKMMFVLLPLFALILRIAFYKSKKYYVEHLIFAFHFHCFVFLFVSVILVIEAIIPQRWTNVVNALSGIEFVVIAFYFYKALRTFYHRSRFRTITKMIGITLTDLLLSFFCLMGVVVITALISR